jgi:uncharacterized protein (DUF488 family)
MTHEILTVGHSSLPIDQFIGLLTQHDVHVVVDVRSQPVSRRFPQFSYEDLKDTLRHTGIQYLFLGRELGARRTEPEVYVDDQASYELIAKCPDFREGVRRVIVGADRYRMSLMCAEKDPLTCHRAILVCRNLKSFGLSICHICGDGSLESHADAEQRLIKEEGVHVAQSDLFDTACRAESALSTAYTQRGLKIAYRRPSERLT